MPRDLFGDVSHPSVRLGSQSRYTVTLSLLVHVIVIITLVLVPLMATGALPAPRSVTIFVANPTLPEPPPAPRVARQERPLPVTPDAAPVDVPEAIRPETGLQVGFEDQVEGVPGVIDGAVSGDASSVLAPPPPPPPPPPKQPVRVGGRISPPAKVRDVAPKYPAIAQTVGAKGDVILEAIIGEDGRVRELRVLKSHPLLDQAAMDAVRQWEYSPTLLNGVAVPVLMTVTVRFDLRR